MQIVYRVTESFQNIANLGLLETRLCLDDQINSMGKVLGLNEPPLTVIACCRLFRGCKKLVHGTGPYEVELFLVEMNFLYIILIPIRRTNCGF
jgi:hypothetical protein